MWAAAAAASFRLAIIGGSGRNLQPRFSMACTMMGMRKLILIWLCGTGDALTDAYFLYLCHSWVTFYLFKGT